MANIKVEVKNTSNLPVTLPDRFGGYEIPANGERVITMNPESFHRLRLNVDASELDGLEGLEDDPAIDIDVGSTPSDSTGSLKHRMSQAERVDRPNQIWVSPDGDDANPGTYESPLGGIQTAIDRLDDQFSFDHLKFVNLKVTGQPFVENIVVNTQSLILRGESGSAMIPGRTNQAVIKPADPTRPICTVTNLTKQGVDDYETAGGFDYTWSAPDSYSYTGASVSGLDVRDGPEDTFSNYLIDFDVLIDGVAFFAENSPIAANPEALLILGVPYPGNDYMIARNIVLKSCFVYGREGTAMAWKNATKNKILNCQFDGRMVVDTGWPQFGTAGQGAIYRGKTWLLGDLIMAGDSGLSDDEGGIGFAPIFDSFRGVARTEDVYILDGVISDNGERLDLSSGVDHDFVHASSGDMGSAESRARIRCNSYKGLGAGNVFVSTLGCKDFTHSGGGSIQINDLQCHGGGATFSDGANHLVRSGSVKGDLVVEGGATADLLGLVIEGDLIIRNAGTQVDCEGCHVQGSVQINDDVDQDQYFYGGSIIGSGHTNTVRDENGNDASGSTYWNRDAGV